MHRPYGKFLIALRCGPRAAVIAIVLTVSASLPFAGAVAAPLQLLSQQRVVSSGTELKLTEIAATDFADFSVSLPLASQDSHFSGTLITAAGTGGNSVGSGTFLTGQSSFFVEFKVTQLTKILLDVSLMSSVTNTNAFASFSLLNQAHVPFADQSIFRNTTFNMSYTIFLPPDTYKLGATAGSFIGNAGSSAATSYSLKMRATVVPEPSTAVMASIACGLLCLLRTRFKKP